MTAIGKVKPVITVERHELRNKNTMPMVSSAPSSKVCCTFFTANRMGRDASPMGSMRMPAKAVALDSAKVSFRACTTSMVFSSCAFWTCNTKVRSPL